MFSRGDGQGKYSFLSKLPRVAGCFSKLLSKFACRMPHTLILWRLFLPTGSSLAHRDLSIYCGRNTDCSLRTTPKNYKAQPLFTGLRGCCSNGGSVRLPCNPSSQLASSNAYLAAPSQCGVFGRSRPCAHGVVDHYGIQLRAINLPGFELN